MDTCCLVDVCQECCALEPLLKTIVNFHAFRNSFFLILIPSLLTLIAVPFDQSLNAMSRYITLLRCSLVAVCLTILNAHLHHRDLIAQQSST